MSGGKWTQADVDALRASIKQGVLAVKYQDRAVTYRSSKAMLDLLAEMERDVACQSNQARPLVAKTSHSRGL